MLAPGGLTHDFENRSSARAGLLNISAPGNFEKNMPEINQWLSRNGPRRADAGDNSPRSC